MRALIVGIDGFVGGHLKKELISNEYDIIGTSLRHSSKNILKMDILDYKSVFEVIERVKPDVIFHVAGPSSVSMPWRKPHLTV